MPTMTFDEVQRNLKDLLGWRLENQVLSKEFVFPTFTDAMIFVNELAQAAEDMEQYPHIGIHQNKVLVRCQSDGVDGVTDKDLELAKKAQSAEKMIFGDLVGKS